MRLIPDEERKIEENTPDEGELEMPGTLEQGKAENWVHASPNILLVNNDITCYRTAELPTLTLRSPMMPLKAWMKSSLKSSKKKLIPMSLSSNR